MAAAPHIDIPRKVNFHSICCQKWRRGGGMLKVARNARQRGIYRGNVVMTWRPRTHHRPRHAHRVMAARASNVRNII